MCIHLKGWSRTFLVIVCFITRVQKLDLFAMDSSHVWLMKGLWIDR